MQWQDKAFILGCKAQGERNKIVEVMSATHGRYFGLVRGGNARSVQPVLQAGNFVSVEWNARLEEHLGFFRLEILKNTSAAFIENALSLYGLQLLCAHLRLLPERMSHKALYDILELIAFQCQKPLILAELLVRFELLLLKELGVGLDLKSCVVSGDTENLCYVSPKSGRAVSAKEGEFWKDKLLPLPQFLLSPRRRIESHKCVEEGFYLTGYFLERYIWRQRGLSRPEIRQSFLQKYFSKTFEFYKQIDG